MDLPYTNKDIHEFIRSGGRQLEAGEAVELARLVLQERARNQMHWDTTLRPELVYHYCGAEAFKGILETLEIWLADSAYTNDTAENQYCIEMARQILNDRLGDEVQGRVIRMLETLRQPPRIACFSKRGDSLSQWRAYADDGRGYAIGISVPALGVKYNDPGSSLQHDTDGAQKSILFQAGVSLVGIVYDPSVQEELLDMACEQYRKLRVGKNGEASDGEKAAFTEFLLRLHFILLVLKQPGFAEEQEFRLIDQLAVQISMDKAEALKRPERFRVTRESVQPYVPYSLGNGEKSAIVHVRLGPRNRSQVNTVLAMLARRGLVGVTVERSTVTYRG